MLAQQQHAQQQAEDEERHHQAFGEHTGISEDLLDIIDKIKDDKSGVFQLILKPRDAVRFTNQAWTLLGRYIANNTWLSRFNLKGCSLNNQKISALFTSLTKSSSITSLYLDNNEFGIEGLRTMVPFLLNSPKLNGIDMGKNDFINSDCFELLVNTLHRVSSRIHSLSLLDCSVTDISALETYPLSDLGGLCLNGNNIHSVSVLENYTKLATLYLRGSNIGREGCITISNLLQQVEPNLINLVLDNTGMGDEEAELLATSLGNNSKLRKIDLQHNNITEKGCHAFLKLLNDVSSIECTTRTTFWKNVRF